MGTCTQTKPGTCTKKCWQTVGENIVLPFLLRIVGACRYQKVPASWHLTLGDAHTHEVGDAHKKNTGRTCRERSWPFRPPKFRSSCRCHRMELLLGISTISSPKFRSFINGTVKTVPYNIYCSAIWNSSYISLFSIFVGENIVLPFLLMSNVKRQAPFYLSSLKYAFPSSLGGIYSFFFFMDIIIKTKIVAA